MKILFSFVSCDTFDKLSTKGGMNSWVFMGFSESEDIVNDADGCGWIVSNDGVCCCRGPVESVPR